MGGPCPFQFIQVFDVRNLRAGVCIAQTNSRKEVGCPGLKIRGGSVLTRTPLCKGGTGILARVLRDQDHIDQQRSSEGYS